MLSSLRTGRRRIGGGGAGEVAARRVGRKSGTGRGRGGGGGRDGATGEEDRVASGEERMMKEKGKKMTCRSEGKIDFLHHL